MYVANTESGEREARDRSDRLTRGVWWQQLLDSSGWRCHQVCSADVLSWCTGGNLHTYCLQVQGTASVLLDHGVQGE
jgi:hypothetical protein